MRGKKARALRKKYLKEPSEKIIKNGNDYWIGGRRKYKDAKKQLKEEK